MGFDISALTEYVSPGTELLLKGILPINLKHFSVQSGITGLSAYLNFLNVTPVKVGGYCSTASGDDVLTEKLLTVAEYNYRDNFCVKDLENYALQNVDVVASLAEDFVRVPSTDAQHDIWIGDIVGSGDLIDGFMTILGTAGSGAILATPTAAPTLANISGIVRDMISKQTTDMRARGVNIIYMSPSNFDLYVQARVDANQYSDINVNLSADEIWANGKINRVLITSNEGLTTDEMIMTWADNLVIGADEISNITSLEFKEADDRSVNAFLDFKLGVQVKENSEVVYYANI